MSTLPTPHSYLESWMVTKMKYQIAKPRLPAEYQEVEYIESHGTEYININFHYTSNDCEVDLAFEILDISTNNIRWFGSFEGTNRATVIQSNNTMDRIIVGLGGTDVYTDSLSLNHKYKLNIKANNNAYNITINGNNYTGSYTGTIANDRNINVFRMSTSYAQYLGMPNTRYYPIGIKQNGQDVRLLVPCFRKSDGVIGLYDLCGSICPLTSTPFYINSGTGAFTKGANKTELVKCDIARGVGEFSQLAKELNSTNWTGGSSANVTYLNGVATARITSIGYWAGILQPGTNFELDHKLVVVFKARYNSATYSKLLVALRCAGYYNSNNYVNVSNSDLTQVGVVLNITSYRYTSNNDFIIVADYGYSETPIINDSIEIKDVNIFDLTSLFGSGNEPTTYAEARQRILQKYHIDIANYVPYGTQYVIERTNIWHDLPRAYQRVEWIESHGTEYVDTGIKMQPSYYLETTMALTELGSFVQYGAIQQVGSDYARCHYGYATNPASIANKLIMYANKEGDGAIIEPDTNYHKYYCYKSGSYFISGVDDTTFSTTFFQYPNVNQCLFARNFNGVVGNLCKSRLKSHIIKDGSNFIQNLIPCYRKSDNVIGLYDTINDKFYINQGTGTFGKGADIN